MLRMIGQETRKKLTFEDFLKPTQNLGLSTPGLS